MLVGGAGEVNYVNTTEITVCLGLWDWWGWLGCWSCGKAGEVACISEVGRIGESGEADWKSWEHIILPECWNWGKKPSAQLKPTSLSHLISLIISNEIVKFVKV